MLKSKLIASDTPKNFDEVMNQWIQENNIAYSDIRVINYDSHLSCAEGPVQSVRGILYTAFVMYEDKRDESSKSKKSKPIGF